MPTRQRPPDPEDYRHLEDFVIDDLRRAGATVERTGQEYRPDLGRWSPDLHVQGPSGAVWVDPKIRNRGYGNYLVEDAELERHYSEFVPTVYALVADAEPEKDLPIQIMGWASAGICRAFGGPVRSDHRGTGSGDPYRLIPIRFLWPWSRLLEHIGLQRWRVQGAQPLSDGHVNTATSGSVQSFNFRTVLKEDHE